MTSKQLNDPARRRLEFNEPDFAMLHGMRTPSRKNELATDGNRQRQPLTPVNYTNGSVARPAKLELSSKMPPSRLPGCESAKPIKKQNPGAENVIACRDSKLKTMMSSAKPDISVRKPIISKPPAGAVHAISTASAIRATKPLHSKLMDSASQQRGTKPFTMPHAPPSVSRPAVLASAKPANSKATGIPGGSLMRIGSVSHIPLPKATPSAKVVAPTVNRVSPQRAFSMLDLSAAQPEPEPMTPSVRRIPNANVLFGSFVKGAPARGAMITSTDSLASVGLETASVNSESESLPATAPEIYMSMPGGLNEKARSDGVEVCDSATQRRRSVSMTCLNPSRGETEGEAEFTLIDFNEPQTVKPNDPPAQDEAVADVPTPKMSPAPKGIANASEKFESQLNAYAEKNAQLELDLRGVKDEVEQCKAELATVQNTLAERDTRITELQQSVTERDGRVAELVRSVEEQKQMLQILEEYNDNCTFMMNEEQRKYESARAELAQFEAELDALRVERARLESEVACERDATSQADAFKRELDAARLEAITLRRELVTVKQNHELLTLESTRVAANKDEMLASEKRTVSALRGELESARRGASAKFAELRAEVDGALAERDTVRFELEKLQIAHAEACADRDAARSSADARSQELTDAKRRIAALSARADDDSHQRAIATLRTDVDRLTRENACLNSVVNERIETIANEFDTLMRTLATASEDRERALLERSVIAPDRTLNASMMLNSTRYGGSRGSSSASGITYEKLERLVSDQFSMQKQLADRDCTIGRLRDQMATAEFTREKTVRELRSLEKLLVRIFRRLQHNVDTMNDECKQLVAELRALLSDRVERHEANAQA